MTTASKNQARDLEADLLMCERWDFGNPNNDNTFIRQAREGWPYAIRRAMEAEAEVDRLRAENAMLLEALNQRGCGL